MKRITKYKAKDGTEFDKKRDCLMHDLVVVRLKKLFAKLPARKADSAFTGGKGWIQHNGLVFIEVRDKFYKMARKHEGIDKCYQDGSYGFWRSLSDSGSVFYGFGHRILCTDTNTWREYGQPYYATNPNEAKGGQINT